MTEIGNVTVRVDAVITDEQYREAMGAVKAANERMDLLEAENAKLRELVRDLYQCSRQCGCDRCGYKDGCAMFDRMAQMGVKVEA